MDSPVEVRIFTTGWCGYCRRLKHEMAAGGIDYEEIDIEEHPEYGEMIEKLTGGYRTVPTLEICGNYLVNPTLEMVVEAVADCRAPV